MSKKTDQNDWEELSWYTLMHRSCGNGRAVIEKFAYTSKGYPIFKCRCTLCGESFFWGVSEEQASEYVAASARRRAVAHTDEWFAEIEANFNEEVFNEIIDAEGLDPTGVFLMQIGPGVEIMTMDLNRKRSFDELYGDSRKQLIKLVVTVFEVAQRFLASTGRF